MPGRIRLDQETLPGTGVVIGSLFEKRTEGLYHNTAVVIDAKRRSVANTGKCISR